MSAETIKIRVRLESVFELDIFLDEYEPDGDLGEAVLGDLSDMGLQGPIKVWHRDVLLKSPTDEDQWVEAKQLRFGDKFHVGGVVFDTLDAAIRACGEKVGDV